MADEPGGDEQEPVGEPRAGELPAQQADSTAQAATPVTEQVTPSAATPAASPAVATAAATGAIPTPTPTLAPTPALAGTFQLTATARPLRGPHPVLIPVVVLGAVLLLMLGLVGFANPGVREVLDTTRPHTSAAAPPADVAPPAPATPTPTPTPRTEIAVDEIKAVATAQGDALRAGDVDAFLAPYDPAKPELLAERRRAFANLRLIPFTRSLFRWERITSGSLSARDGGPVKADVSIEFVHQIPGVDLAPAVQTYRWTVTRETVGAPLRITAVTDDDPQAWDLAELVKVERPHVILLAAVVDRAKSAQWADRAETAAKRDLALWKGPADIPSRFLVFASPDPATFGRAYGGDAPNGTVAFCSPVLRDRYDSGADAGRPIAGSRITWDTDAKGMGAYDAQTGVMRHEMGHALMAGFSGTRAARVPLWVVEGFAEYLEWADLFGDYYAPDAREYVRGRSFPGKIPTDDQIYGDDPETNGINYHLSMTVIRYMVDKYGAAKTYTFVIAVYREPDSVDASLKTATGLDKATFEANWAKWVKNKV
ncbi:peptidase MA family metallohydrolase [Yinghuangia sp. YIM S09857]|uniref:peptidase MA family metallohydrolase n=1 Tax=Yinghuangia sp. YIM S09857 TaxID=3436929 RepID=UPI003F534229